MPEDCEISDLFIDSLDEDTILSDETFEFILDIPDTLEQKKLITNIKIKAKKLGLTRHFDELLKAHRIDKAKQFQSQDKGRTTQFVNQPIKLNCGEWQADDGGIKKNEMNFSSGEIICKFASPIPLLPTEILVNVDTNIVNLYIHRIMLNAVLISIVIVS